MKTVHLLLLFFLVTTACSHLPPLEPLSSTSGTQARCRSIYPQGEWQLVHSIAVVMPDSGRATMMGITQLSSSRRTLHCVLLTLEGMVLFEARYDGRIEVRRALPPFDAPAFAQGIFDDIMLMLLPPETAPIAAGRQAEQALVCRWQLPDGWVQDNMLYADQSWQIRRYNTRNRLVRQVTAAGSERPDPGRPVPDMISLKAFGLLGYELTLTLLDAQPIELVTPNEKGIP
jgi:hypothetical protein